jgi:hypothetical protein
MRKFEFVARGSQRFELETFLRNALIYRLFDSDFIKTYKF